MGGIITFAGLVILAYIFYSVVGYIRDSKPENRKRIIAIWAVALCLGAGAYTALTMTGVAERIYMQLQVAEGKRPTTEQGGVLPIIIDRDENGEEYDAFEWTDEEINRPLD